MYYIIHQICYVYILSYQKKKRHYPTKLDTYYYPLSTDEETEIREII